MNVFDFRTWYFFSVYLLQPHPLDMQRFAFIVARRWVSLMLRIKSNSWIFFSFSCNGSRCEIANIRQKGRANTISTTWTV